MFRPQCSGACRGLKAFARGSVGKLVTILGAIAERLGFRAVLETPPPRSQLRSRAIWRTDHPAIRIAEGQLAWRHQMQIREIPSWQPIPDESVPLKSVPMLAAHSLTDFVGSVRTARQTDRMIPVPLRESLAAVPEAPRQWIWKQVPPLVPDQRRSKPGRIRQHSPNSDRGTNERASRAGRTFPADGGRPTLCSTLSATEQPQRPCRRSDKFARVSRRPRNPDHC